MADVPKEKSLREMMDEMTAGIVTSLGLRLGICVAFKNLSHIDQQSLKNRFQFD